MTVLNDVSVDGRGRERRGEREKGKAETEAGDRRDAGAARTAEGHSSSLAHRSTEFMKSVRPWQS